MSSTIVQKTSAEWDWKLWLQWVVANAASETVGLGTTLLIGAFLLVNAEPTIGSLPAAALDVLAGTVIEGSIVGAAQWLALRRHVPKAGWWIPGNALAWMLGIVVVFLGTSFIPAERITLPVALIMLLFVVAAGAVVGAVHGLVLI
jgi:hypothetical protein